LGTAAGVTGRGVGIAIIDSGVTVHSALRGKVVASVDFTAEQGATARDFYGHGTHIAGVIAGQGDTFRGMAPGAHLVNLRVIDANGAGRTSSVIEAIDWAIDHRAEYGLRILNISLGHPVLQSYKDDPLVAAVERATAAGLVVVTSAGNVGKTTDGRPIVGAIASPGNAPSAITVGATNAKGTAARSDDVMATYSSRGPTYIDGLLKPDLVAPGNKVVSTLSPGSTAARQFPERIVAGAGLFGYVQMSGTSISSAVVAGAAALVLEANPALKPAQVKFALQVTAGRLPHAGLVSGDGLEHFLDRAIPARTFAELRLPFAAVATDLATGLRVDGIPPGAHGEALVQRLQPLHPPFLLLSGACG
jgi:serine protease AprX